MKMNKLLSTAGLVLCLGAVTAAPSLAIDLPADPYTYTWEELAPGVWSGWRKNPHLTPVMGTSTFVVSDKGVVVFDGGGSPLMTDRLMKKIASVTDKPITHLVVSHWHGDHMFGAWRIVEEYPDVEVIMHSFTLAATLGAPMDYLKRQDTAIDRYIPIVEEALAKDESGEEPLKEGEREGYEYLLANADLLRENFQKHNYVLPTTTFEQKLTIYSGDREIQIMHPGDGNTEGDAIMWLPDEKIVATGDVVVWPTPYAFNVSPRKWVATLRNVNDLDYEILVPGHGEIQWDTAYVDLMIEALTSVADQTDQFIEQGMTQEEAGAALDFSAFDERFLGGSEYLSVFYEAYFTGPLRSAAWRAAKGEVMVKLERDPEPEAPAEEE